MTTETPNHLTFRAGIGMVCDEANLPSFPEWDDARAYLATCGENPNVQIRWKCPACTGWHFWTSPPQPAGMSSGNGRNQPVPKRILRLANFIEIDGRYEPR